MLIITSSAYCFTGKLNVNVEPKPSFSSVLLVAHILPPCISIILFEINSPKPVPPLMDLVVNFVKSFGNTSGCIPVPVSFIPTRISSFLPFISFFSFLQQ